MTQPHGAPAAPSAPTAPSEPGTSTAVLERTETRRQRDDGDGDRFAHFVRRDRVNQSLESGGAVVALCGKIWIPLRDPSGYPVCPRCKALRDEMKNMGPSWPFFDGNEGGTPRG
ncbi:MAG: DUF3039 domain-containing protein [Actinomycetaceae bacterium]|nr:DUF3039 domain-containing protein [Actinomycetaceae bacterium]